MIKLWAPCLAVFVVALAHNTNGKDPFTLDEFIGRDWSDKTWNGQWLNDKECMYIDNGEYKILDVEANSINPAFEKTFVTSYKDGTVTLSSDRKYALVKHNVEKVYRHSTLANYDIIDLHSGKSRHLSINDNTDKKFQLVKFRPDKNELVVVQENNIYYVQDIFPDEGKYVGKLIVRGSFTEYNGVPDWVYEEEVFASDSAIWMKDDFLVYAKFDDAKVEDMHYFMYGKPSSIDDQYPDLVTLKYPKAGTPNPTFSLWSYNFKSGKVPQMIGLKFDKATSADYILYDVRWSGYGKFYVTMTNRVQNEGKIVECEADNAKCTDDLVKNMQKTNGWLDIQPPLVYEDKPVQLLTTKNFDQIVVHTDNPITLELSQDKSISKLYGIKGDLIYFEGNVFANHSQQHVYSVNIKSKVEECLTCTYKLPDDTFCKYASASFSTEMSYMIRTCHGPGPAYVDAVKVADKSRVRLLEENKNVREALKQKSMPQIQDIMIDLGLGANRQAAVRMLLPPNFNSSRSYPMLVDVYAGPGSKKISDAYGIDLGYYLSTNRSYIYAMIDGRGSAKRGRDLTQTVYQKLGQFEVDDQINTVKKLKEKYSYIDAKRIGIWGWSYGGFATAWAISRDIDVFACGVSVAPVTNYIYYDSIYTERYMKTPNENKEGYGKTDVTKDPKKFHGKNFLLVHGNADDNVHYQQAMMLARALELEDVKFQQISYPDENHSLKGVYKHLYHSLDAFWAEHFADTRGSGATSMYLSGFLGFLLVLRALGAFY